MMDTARYLDSGLCAHQCVVATAAELCVRDHGLQHLQPLLLVARRAFL